MSPSKSNKPTPIETRDAHLERLQKRVQQMEKAGQFDTVHHVNLANYINKAKSGPVDIQADLITPQYGDKE